MNVRLSEVWAKGGEGALELADEVMRLVEEPSDLRFAYEDGADIADALEAVATKVYRADGVDFTPAIEASTRRGCARTALAICPSAWRRPSTPSR